MATDAVHRRQGDRYMVDPSEIEAFHRDGYVHLRGVMSDDEMAEIEAVYERFLRGEIAVEGKDFNDMTTGEHGTDPKGYAVVNVMLPAATTRLGRATCSSAVRSPLPNSCAARA